MGSGPWHDLGWAPECSWPDSGRSAAVGAALVQALLGWKPSTRVWAGLGWPAALRVGLGPAIALPLLPGPGTVSKLLLTITRP